MSGCDRCGCYMRGLQDAYWVTYLVNVATTAAREELERERSNHPRYGEKPAR